MQSGDFMEFMQGLLDGLLDAVLSFFPTSPFREVISTLGEMPFLGYINWFIPIGTFAKIGTVWLGAIALFYAYSVIARWVKAIE